MSEPEQNGNPIARPVSTQITTDATTTQAPKDQSNQTVLVHKTPMTVTEILSTASHIFSPQEAQALRENPSGFQITEHGSNLLTAACIHNQNLQGTKQNAGQAQVPYLPGEVQAINRQYEADLADALGDREEDSNHGSAEDIIHQEASSSAFNIPVDEPIPSRETYPMPEETNFIPKAYSIPETRAGKPDYKKMKNICDSEGWYGDLHYLEDSDKPLGRMEEEGLVRRCCP
ncbi:Hypothetical predicted protein [Lecanosticta acicola]|uniref:Uncharacterized protein n=1 Tax=Lecanosticta acicola TaxID=111012 RepID=A0AAI9EAH4_9PEZI|nr:Hypothetical predicted protein [Lecanosticta acicola]